MLHKGIAFWGVKATGHVLFTLLNYSTDISRWSAYPQSFEKSQFLVSLTLSIFLPICFSLYLSVHICVCLPSFFPSFLMFSVSSQPSHQYTIFVPR